MYDDIAGEEDLLATLREALEEAAAVPAAVVQAGYAAYTWRTIDSELAALSYDSALEPAASSGARSQEAGVRSMTFASASLTIELEFTAHGVLGQLVPTGAPGVLLRLQDGTSRMLPVDEVGCFTIEPAPAAPFRLRVGGDVPVSTDWISV